MIIAIHQPNYLPWIGYFRKIFTADYFIFLDDATFSKGSVTNRVRIMEDSKPVWLTIPANPPLGTSITDVEIAKPDWSQRHLNRLHNAYRTAPCFSSVWMDVQEMFAELPNGNLGEINRYLIERLCAKIGITSIFYRSFNIPNPKKAVSDDRLIDLILSIPGAKGYLSGSGGRKYQDESKFTAAGLELYYNDYIPQPYLQTAHGFEPGLSIIDALFNVGWDGVRDLIMEDHV
tara:strand:+ start:2147 stop:2842 length:696 start_codon:yes stop_codon:yes gene_type:complete